MVDERQKAYARKHLEKLDEIKIRPVKGTKERWRAAADAAGVSLQQFIIQSVERAISHQPAAQTEEYTAVAYYEVSTVNK